MAEGLRISIGGVSISIEGDVKNVSPAYRPFVGAGKTDIRLRLHRGLPDGVAGEKVFACPPMWTLYRENGTSIIQIFDELPGLERTLVLPDDPEQADLYFANGSDRFNDPFYGPTMELLIVNYLAKARGVIIHACGVAMDGRGILFVGESGAGKTTLARMWDQEDGVDVVSDDRVIVRKSGQAFWMYGTPWHGEGKFASARGLRLERIFFLRQGQENSVTESKGTDTVSQLLTCSFPPYWDAQGMACAMELFTDLTSHVPCQQLTFTPDPTALELVRRGKGTLKSHVG